MDVACPIRGLLPGDVGQLPDEARLAGARHLFWPARRRPGPQTALETARLARIIREAAPDLVHLHSAKAGLAGRLVLRGRVPTVFQPHAWSFDAAGGLLGAAALSWERVGAPWAHTLLCVSEGERRRGEAARIRPPQWAVIPNGVDLDRFPAASDEERDAARSRLRLEGGPLAVCVGRLSAQKGQDVLIDVWPSVQRRVPDARLALVGSGPLERALRARDVAGVAIAGERRDVVDWYAAADVVVFPSRWEGMALTLLEAMATGRSVVATDVAGAREALGGNAGAVVPVERSDQLAEAIADRLLDPAAASAEGRTARRRVEASHDLRATTRAVAELYERLVQ